MKEVQAEGMKFVYLSKEDNLPDQENVANAPFVYARWDDLLTQNRDDMRPVLFTWPFRPDTPYIYFLHWDDGSDLDKLDEKVAQGNYTDEDFKNSVITTFGRTFCLKRDWIAYTLVMFTAEYYVGKPELEMSKVREHTFIENCPNCGARLTLFVAKIF